MRAFSLSISIQAICKKNIFKLVHRIPFRVWPCQDCSIFPYAALGNKFTVSVSLLCQIYQSVSFHNLHSMLLALIIFKNSFTTRLDLFSLERVNKHNKGMTNQERCLLLSLLENKLNYFNELFHPLFSFPLFLFCLVFSLKVVFVFEGQGKREQRKGEGHSLQMEFA